MSDIPEQPKRRAKKKTASAVEEQYSPAQAADKLQVNRATIRRWIKAGKIKPVRHLGRKCVRIPASSINAFLEANTI